MRVIVTLRARRDLEEAISFVRTEHPDYARRMAQAIRRTIQSIGERPYLGISNARAPHLRSRLVLGFSYRVHYDIRSDAVRIVHIRHTARRTWNPINNESQ
jgi:plasmid stabilization system protein ParE